MRFGMSALSATVAIGLLAGCSGAAAVNPGQSPSWMAPDAHKRQALLYISDIESGEVFVYSYPSLAVAGTLTGFSEPAGTCVDTTGDVFIVDYGASDIVEYAHGGLTPIATLDDPGLRS